MGFFQTFPSEWEWVALIVGTLGFLMAVQPFIQMIWGRPKIQIQTGKGELNGTPYLEFVIINEPIRKGPTAWLRLHRETASEIFASITLEEDNTGRVIAKELLPELARRGTGQPGAQRVSLPASLFGVTALVAFRSREANSIVIGGPKGATQVLSPGQYKATISVMGEGKAKRLSQKFMVNADGTLYWLSN
ncbi:MAG: hypothetical protein ACE5JU_20375 [Candidatus Binatia bacterium]